MNAEWALAGRATSDAAMPVPGVDRGAGDRRWSLGAWTFLGVAGTIAGLALRSGESWIAALPPCAMRQAFHIGCPTCGFTRALVRLARGDFAGAWTLHPLAIPVALAAVLGWLFWGAGLWRRRSVIPRKWWARAVAIMALATMGVWLVRLALGTIPV